MRERSLLGGTLLAACASSSATGDTSGECAPEEGEHRPAGLASHRGLCRCAPRGEAGEQGAEGRGLRGESLVLGLLGRLSALPRSLCGLPCTRCRNCRRPARMPARKEPGHEYREDLLDAGKTFVTSKWRSQHLCRASQASRPGFQRGWLLAWRLVQMDPAAARC